MCYSKIWQNFGGDKYLCKSDKKYLNASLCKCVIFLQHSETFDVSHIFLPLTIAELSTLKQVRVFLAHPVYRHVAHQRCADCGRACPRTEIRRIFFATRTDSGSKVDNFCGCGLCSVTRVFFLKITVNGLWKTCLITVLFCDKTKTKTKTVKICLEAASRRGTASRHHVTVCH